MPQFEPGEYIIFPKNSNNPPAFGIGPIPLIWPPQDVSVKVLDKLINSWAINLAENNTFTVFASALVEGPVPYSLGGYRWIVTDQNKLYVSWSKTPESFRFESAGDGLWKIGLFGQDAFLTYDAKSKTPRLTFKPADGSDAQLFHAEEYKK